jgi:hypothetical protein
MEEPGTMKRFEWPDRVRRLGMAMIAVAVICALAGGCGTPSPHTSSRNYGLRGDVPVDPPRPHSTAADDCAAGGELFRLYCGSCHNARPLGERPFSNYHVALTHMRNQAYLTGKEYRQIMLFLRRWHDLGPPTPPVEPSPKRLIFSQPIAELRGETAAAGSAPPPAPGSGPWQQLQQQPGAEGLAPPRQPGAPSTGPLQRSVGPAGASPPQPLPSGLPAPIN